MYCAYAKRRAPFRGIRHRWRKSAHDAFGFERERRQVSPIGRSAIRRCLILTGMTTHASHFVLLAAVAVLPCIAAAAPACVVPDAKNIVVATSPSDLTDGHSAEWLLERVDGTRRVLLKPCSGRHANKCYFATDVEPGRYYFKELVPGAYNRLQYLVSTPDTWFEIGGQGVDYIGDWIIDRSNRRTNVKLQVGYDLKNLDAIVALCRLEERKLFLGRTQSPSLEIVDSAKPKK